MNAFCDVLVVGSGPAGLTAARAAAERGKRVILAELDPRFGGTRQLVGRDDRRHAGRGLGRAASWASSASRGNVRLLHRTTVWGYYDDNTLAALERVADHTRGGRHGRAPPSAMDDPRRRRGAGDRRASSGRWSFPATTGPA